MSSVLFAGLRRSRQEREVAEGAQPPAASARLSATSPTKKPAVSKRRRSLLLGAGAVAIGGGIAFGALHFVSPGVKPAPPAQVAPQVAAVPPPPTPSVVRPETVADSPAVAAGAPVELAAKQDGGDGIAPASSIDRAEHDAPPAAMTAPATAGAITPAAPPEPASDTVATAVQTATPPIASMEPAKQPAAAPDALKMLSPVKPTQRGHAIAATGQTQPARAGAIKPAPTQHTPTEQEVSKEAGDLTKAGKFGDAVVVYDSGLKTWPTSLILLRGKADAAHGLKAYGDEWAINLKILSLSQGNPALLMKMVQASSSLPPDTAIANLRGLATSYPSFSAIPAQIAVLEAGLNEVPAAIEALTQAAAIEPNNGLYRLNLAILQDRAGLASDAVASYENAMNLLGSNLPLPAEQIARRISVLSRR